MVKVYSNETIHFRLDNSIENALKHMGHWRDISVETTLNE